MGFHGDTEQNCSLFTKAIVPPYSLPTDITAQKAIYSDKFCPEIVLRVKPLTHEYKDSAKANVVKAQNQTKNNTKAILSASCISTNSSLKLFHFLN